MGRYRRRQERARTIEEIALALHGQLFDAKPGWYPHVAPDPTEPETSAMVCCAFLFRRRDELAELARYHLGRQAECPLLPATTAEHANLRTLREIMEAEGRKQGLV